MSLKRLRNSIEESCDVLQAVLSFNYRYSEVDKAKLDSVRKMLMVGTTKELEYVEPSIQADAAHVARLFGCKMNPASFAKTFMQISRAGKGIPMISKYVIETAYFSNFAENEPIWRGLSPHLLLQVHFDWIVNLERIVYRYHLPEATLYEDMAFAYNSALQIDPSSDSDGNAEADIDLKKRNFYLRTAVLSAFYFVEAYLNGMAFDYCYRNQSALSTDDQAFLLEEPSTKNKRGFVSFEMKAVQFLKIITSVQHPPLQETNCPPLKYMLNEGKDLRDSIVHQSPKIDGTSGVPEKIQWMMSLDTQRVTETVDAAVQLVREINSKIGSSASPLDWLHTRTAEGLFPKETFL